MADRPSPRQQADDVTRPASPVHELLLAYQGVLDAVDDLPAVPLVLWTHADRGLFARLRYLPRPKWLLCLFVVRHFDARLALFARRYSARAALGSLTESELRDREAVEEFRQSLPPVRQVVHVALVLVAVLLVVRPLLLLMPSLIPRAAPTGQFALRLEVFDQLAQGFSTDAASIDKALNALFNGGPQQTAAVAFMLAVSSYLVLRPFVPAFRLKRMLLNLSPDRCRPLPSATSRWSVSQATGIYERERQAFAELGVRQPREFPFDLAVPVLAMLVPLVMALSGFNEALTASTPAADRWLSGVMGTLILVGAVVRLGWLYRMWRRRLGPSGPCMPFEVGIGSGLSVAKVERPVGARILVFAVFLLLGGAGAERIAGETLLQHLEGILVFAVVCSVPVSFAWWSRIDRELRSVDQRPVRRRSIGQRLFMRVLAIAGDLTVLPALIVTGRRIRRAQARAGLPETLRFAWLLLPGLLVHPLLVAYLQHELNKIWIVLGQPLDPWTGTPSAPKADLARRLPWLRQPGSRRPPDLPSQHPQREHPVLVAG